MTNPYRLLIALSILIMTSATSFGQLGGFLEAEVRGVEQDRVILRGGEELPVLIQENGDYGPQLDNYPMLLRVGYIDLARLHVVKGVVVRVEVLELYQ